jgi:hypothetical protein
MPVTPASLVHACQSRLYSSFLPVCSRPKRLSHLAAGVTQRSSTPQTDSSSMEQQQAVSDGAAVNSILPVPAGSFNRSTSSSSSSSAAATAAAPAETNPAEQDCNRMLQRVHSLLASHDPPLRDPPAGPGPAALRVPPENVKMLGAGGFSYVVDGELDGRTVAVKLLPIQPLPDALSPPSSSVSSPGQSRGGGGRHGLLGVGPAGPDPRARAHVRDRSASQHCRSDRARCVHKAGQAHRCRCTSCASKGEFRGWDLLEHLPRCPTHLTSSLAPSRSSPILNHL